MFRFRSQLVVLALLMASADHIAANSRATSREHALLKPLVQTGIDVYESMNSEPFAGKRIGLITNQTGVDSDGRRTIDVLAGRKDLKLVALFSPEHGIGGDRDADVPNSSDEKTRVPIYSLYGAMRRPTDEMLKGIDVLVFDIQDAGVRFYTYVTTMAYCMEAAAKHHIKFVVLDRPDPLGGEVIEGPMLDSDRKAFTGYFSMPARYAMTIGELGNMFNAENHIGADLEVVPLKNWSRSESYEETGLRWIPPSPNLRTVNAAFLYPGLEILQAGGVSVGRGTDTPFEVLGAPWIHGGEFAVELSKRKMLGVTFEAVQFTPNAEPYKQELCNGMKIHITDRHSFRAMHMGLEVAAALHLMYPEQFQLEKIISLLGSQSTIDRLKRGDAPEEVISSWKAELDKFRQVRGKYLLYR